ncbi:uncharacterized protein LOC120412275 [Corvus cornix cornix]|uniref:uncharacterized protein LOC120412275 n=1 Tax=Corvus cornix cornix TaxID=932674 RepID=UPI001950C625|nr:uncharacterized protein LOC120412275 [Corvus cornix cornix]
MARRVGAVLAACEIIYGAAGWILERRREREREKTTKLLDSKLNENFLYLRKQMEPLKRVFKKLQEFKPSDLERLRADLEKIPGKKKEEIARALESRLQKKLKNLCRKTEDLEEYVHKWPESTKLDLERLRADLEKIHRKQRGGNCKGPGILDGEGIPASLSNNSNSRRSFGRNSNSRRSFTEEEGVLKALAPAPHRRPGEEPR